MPAHEIPVSVPDVLSSRRSIMTAGAAALGAVVVQAVSSLPTEAATVTVKLGTTNSTSKATTITDTASSSSAKAFTGRTSYTGTATSSAGVRGMSAGNHGTGVLGIANKGSHAFGVWGSSTTGVGIAGSGPIGVQGVSVDPSGAALMGLAGAGPAVVGLSGDDGVGVAGQAGDTLASIGVHGLAGPFGWAGYFDGDVSVVGTLYYPASVMQIDHPDSPGERWYRRAPVGAFERISVVSGNVRTNDRGRATVEVPGLFARYHTAFRYQLTTIGTSADAYVAREVRNGTFEVETSKPHVKVSWQVTGVRDDPSARANDFHVSVVKARAERGRFLEPSVYGKARSRGVGARARSRLTRLSRQSSSKLTADDQ